MQLDDFVGRETEVRTLVDNTDKGRHTMLLGEAGLGKSALLKVAEPLLSYKKRVIWTSRVSPLGGWLRDVFSELWEHKKIPRQTDSLSNDLKEWGKKAPTNADKAKYLIACLPKGDFVIVIDDANSITSGIRPWLEQMAEHAAFIIAIDPKTLKKSGLKRFWKHFEELSIERLNKKDSEALFEKLQAKHNIQADEPEVYKRKVLNLAQGSPFELERLIKNHSQDNEIVQTKNLAGYSQSFVERDEKGVALAPLLLVFAAMGVALRYVARAQGDLDLYVLSGIGIAAFLLAGPFLRKSLRPRSDT